MNHEAAVVESSAPGTQACARPAITWLNMSGDVTITWDESNKANVRALVEKKMAQGYSFFVLTPRALAVLGTKRDKLRSIQQLDKATGLVIPDSQVAAIVAGLGDSDLEQAVRSGHAELRQPPEGVKETVRRATSSEEVLRSQTVAVRPIVGG